MTASSFPPGFLWGAATSAYQVEGAAHEGGRKDSIWDAFSRVPGAVRDGDNGDIACDQYHRYPQDVALLKELNLGAYRFSTSWSRVRPDGVSGPHGINHAGLDYYSRLVDELLDAQIVPWVTLEHWDLPQALQEKGGWANRDVADLFTEFALTVHDALGDRVGVWTTLNEPWCQSFLSYTGGTHAPGLQSPELGLRAAHHLLLAHGQATQALRAGDPHANLGITLNFTVVDPVNPDEPGDVDAARRIDAQFNRVFLDPLFRGAYPADLLADLDRIGLGHVLEDAVHDGDLRTIATPIDTLGVNYYHGEAVSATPDPTPHPGASATSRQTSSPYPDSAGIHWHTRDLPRTGIDWEVQPEGLERLLVRLHTEYTGPAGVALYITENGAAYPDVIGEDGQVSDEPRVTFFREHLAAVLRAIDQGADVRGYLAWSFLDNFEWAWGYSQRFGIVYVDYETQQRIPKSSARWLAKVAAANALVD